MRTNRIADLLDRDNGLAGRGLNAANLPANLLRSLGRLLCKRLDFGRYDGEAAPGVSGASRLNGCIQR